MIEEPPLDLRLPVLALCAWASAIATNLVPAGSRLSLLLIGGLVWLTLIRRCRVPRARRTIMAVGALWLVVSAGVALRGEVVGDSWASVMAKQRATGHLIVEVRGDPLVRPGIEDDRAIVRASVHSIEARGRRSTARVPITLVLRAPDADGLQVGAEYALTARLVVSSYADTAATAVVSGKPLFVRGPSWRDRASGHVRDAIQRASIGQTSAAGLVPALVDGDERALPPGVKDDFQTAGLSHLLAVSGTNFVLLGSAWLGLARRCGIRGRAMIPIGLVGIIALVVLARAEPSVIRAAVMGAVALVGLGTGQRAQGLRALGACVCLIMLFEPSLCLSAGFALSALATAGILCLAGRWRDRLANWMPKLLAEAIAVTLSAYLACLPLIVALSGRLSLVAIPANLAAGIVVGPATILGFLGGAVGLVAAGAGRVVAAPATWCASWIVGVAHWCSRLPHPDLGVGAGVVSLVVIVLISLVLAVSLGWILQRPLWAVPLLTLSMLACVVSLPRGPWPPKDWVLVACDVGQGDGLVVRLGEGRALVVDTGPDPGAMRRCLRDLRIRAVPLLVLTHFHADHVNGLTAVLEGAKVDAIEVTDLPDPEPRAAFVQEAATAARVPIRVAKPGEQMTDGDATWQVLAPLQPPPSDSDSPPNDASVVILLQIRGVRILLMGDEETGSQTVLAGAYSGLKVDVLKVAHHGSAKQDSDLIRQLGAKEALISAGRGNSYGLPKASTLTLLRQAGMRVHRTDQDGALAVVVDGSGAVRVVGR